MNLRLLCSLCAIFMAGVPMRSLYAQSLSPEAGFQQNLGEFDQALQRTEFGAQVERCVLLFASLNEEERKACEELRNALKGLLQEPAFCDGKTITERVDCSRLKEKDTCMSCCTTLGGPQKLCEAQCSTPGL
jgi:hypothetical protein